MRSSTNINTDASFADSPRGFNLLEALWRYRFRATVVLVVSLSAGLVLVLTDTPVYESRATLFIKFGRDQIYRPELGVNASPIVPVVTEQDEMVTNQVQLFFSRDLIVKTIERVGLFRMYPELATPEVPLVPLAWSAIEERLRVIHDSIVPATISWFDGGTTMDRGVKRFVKSLSVSRTRASGLIAVAFRHRDPEIARTTLEALLTEQHQLSAAVNQTSDLAFYELATKEAEARLGDAQVRLAVFRLKNGTLAFSGQVATLVAQRQQLDEALRLARIELAAAEHRASELARQRTNIPLAVPAYTDYMTGSHLTGTVREARNPTLIEIENDVQRNDASRASLGGRMSEILKQISYVDEQVLRASQLDFQRVLLESETTARQENLHNLENRREEAQTLASLERRQASDVSLVQKPTLSSPDTPVRPAPLLYLAIAAMFGTAGALTTAAASAIFGRGASPLIHGLPDEGEVVASEEERRAFRRSERTSRA